MRVANRLEFIWSDRQNRHILLSEKWTEWYGEVSLCKGASQQQNDLAASQQAFYNTMTSDYNQQFGQKSAIAGTLTNTLNPIIAAGPNQFGYSNAQTNVLNSEALQGTGQEYAKAAKSLNENIASAGGGNQFLPSGVASQQRSQLASAAANQSSSELLGIQNAGYQQGYNMYQSALGQMAGVAGLYTPDSSGTNNAGTAANTTLNQIQQENQAANPFNAILGAVGGATSAYLGK